jgi:hypothetical protein
MTIAALQQAFSACFPYLSISLYSKPHDIYQSCPVKYLITETNLVLERLEKHPHNAAVDIFADMTVGELETLFEQEFGLHVQVFRKDGNTWTETTFTDNLSLREQNETAAKSTDAVHSEMQELENQGARTEWFLG